jgi:large conductance mechanosensitive channel
VVEVIRPFEVFSLDRQQILQEVSMLKEFKEFAMRGPVLDLAIGVIIGAAFGAIVTSLVGDLIMPPIGLLMGGLDFKDLFIPLDGGSYKSLDEVRKAGAPVIAYGSFVNSVVNFLIVAFAVFLLVKQANRLKKPVTAPEAPSTKECRFCGMNIPAKAIRCPQCTSELKSA